MTAPPIDARIARILADLTTVKIWCRSAVDLRLHDDAEVEWVVARIGQIEDQLRRLAEYGV